MTIHDVLLLSKKYDSYKQQLNNCPINTKKCLIEVKEQMSDPKFLLGKTLHVINLETLSCVII